MGHPGAGGGPAFAPLACSPEMRSAVAWSFPIPTG
jgi:hypothetical protein